MTTDTDPQDYTHRDDAAWDEMMQRRTASKEAAFLLPFLSPGMSLVDVGCGQGTVTVDLAELLSPGIVRGFDPQVEHIEWARRLAGQRGLTNAGFEVGDIYAPPFEPDSFDCAFAHMVFMHLPAAETALQSLIALVKPGGLIATRDRGSSFHFEGPNAAALGRVHQIVAETTIAISGNANGHAVGEVMNRLCRQAGLEVVHFDADLAVQPAFTREYVLAGPSGQRAIQLGIASQAEIDELRRLWSEWQADPDWSAS